MTSPARIPDLRAAILVGGRSSRMGVPKSMLKLGESFVLEKVVAACAALASEIVVVGDAPVPPAVGNLLKLSDAEGVAGPAAGILAALQHDPDARWLVVSCDLPLISTEAVAWLVEHADLSAAAVMPHLESPLAPEPLFALYEPAARAIMERAAAGGEAAPRRMFSRDQIASPRIPPHLRIAWTNVNTPEDWEAVVARKKCDS